MARTVYTFDWPERLELGVLGEQAYYLQVREGSRLVSVLMSQQQVTDLADRLQELADEVGAAHGFDAEEDSPHRSLGTGLASPDQAAFRVDTVTLAWDPAGEAVIVEARASDVPAEEQHGALADEDFRPEGRGERDDPVGGAQPTDVVPRQVSRDLGPGGAGRETRGLRERGGTGDDGGPDVLVLRIDPVPAAALARQARAVMSEGLPTCPICGAPLNPSGHVCPRANGYQRRRTDA